MIGALARFRQSTAILADRIRVNIAEHQGGLSAGDVDVTAFAVQVEVGRVASGLRVKVVSAPNL